MNPEITIFNLQSKCALGIVASYNFSIRTNNSKIALSFFMWPSKTVQITLSITLYAIAILLIWMNSLDVLKGYRFSDSMIVRNYTEILCTFIIIIWLSLSVSDSWAEFVEAVIKFGVLLFVMLALVLNQNRSTFWVAFAVLIFIGFQEVYEHFKARTVFKGGAQVLFILLAWLTVLHTLAKYFLKLPPDFFVLVIDYVTRIRLILITLFIFIVLLATILNVFPKFSWESKEFLPLRQTSRFFQILLQPIVRAFNITATFIVNTANFFGQVLAEALRFIREVFLDWDLWKTILNVGFIALWSFGLPFTLVLVKPHMISVLQNPSVLVGFGRRLALSNLYLGLAFVAVIIFVSALALTWLARKPERKSVVAQRIAYTAMVIYISVWLATITYFYPLNYIFEIHTDLTWPGIYTLLVLPLALVAVVFQNRHSSTEARAVLSTSKAIRGKSKSSKVDAGEP